MTEFNTIIDNTPGKGTVYTIKFTTDNKEHFERLQEEARKCIDDYTPMNKCYATCVRCIHFYCPRGTRKDSCSDCKGCPCYMEHVHACRCNLVSTGKICPYFMEVK